MLDHFSQFIQHNDSYVMQLIETFMPQEMSIFGKSIPMTRNLRPKTSMLDGGDDVSGIIIHSEAADHGRT